MSAVDHDEHFMRQALSLAREAYDAGEVPVGALVVLGQKVIGKGYNQCERLNDCTAHAEMIALTAAQHFLGAKVLNECTIYVSLEPCAMCAGALAWAQIGRLVYGAADNKKGYTVFSHHILHPKTQLKSSLMEQESTDLMKQFFKRLRTNQ
jgi:tRNA(adenine34) deaminase